MYVFRDKMYVFRDKMYVFSDKMYVFRIKCTYLGIKCTYLGIRCTYLGIKCTYLVIQCTYLGIKCTYLWIPRNRWNQNPRRGDKFKLAQFNPYSICKTSVLIKSSNEFIKYCNYVLYTTSCLLKGLYDDNARFTTVPLKPLSDQ